MLFLRETLTRGLMYPAILLMLSAILFVMLLMFLWPELARTYDMMRVERPGWFHVAEWLRAAIPVWGWIVPVGLVAGVMLLRINSTGPAGWITLLPGGRRIASDMSLANASRLLAILVENDIPFPTALRMTADGVRPAATATAMKQLAGQLELGVPIPSGFRSAAAIPPLWRSLVVAGSNRAELVLGLRQSADIYDHRATNRGEALGNTLPTFLVCVIGGGVTFLYASSLFVPLSQLWNRLGSPL
jgi:type II secretory pathway component PulF